MGLVGRGKREYYSGMEKTKTKKSGLAAIFALCPAWHCLALVSAGFILLHLFTRGNKPLMSFLSENFVRPVHGFLARLCSFFSFSLAELLIYLALGGGAVYIIYSIFAVIRSKTKLKTVYIISMRLLAALLFVYAMFCLLWGVYYYGDDFETVSGLEAGEISSAQLETVTAYFADLANYYGEQVDRDEGLYAPDRAALMDKSVELYDGIAEDFPCLDGPRVRAKAFHFSKLMSYADFTGFFFPFTAEANVNTDFPPGLFASTIAHELAHQRGVAKEQEANFVAVLASLRYGDADYCYSACLLAYTHLGNALYGADQEAWREIYAGLSDNVLRDFAAARDYWAQFETPVQAVSNAVYEGFLHSYDQSLGLKSYGACVDLLVNYYYEQAAAALG